MLAGRRAFVLSLVVCGIACSTEEVGLYNVDGSINSTQDLQVDAGRDAFVYRPDRDMEAPPPEDGGVDGVDAPAPIDVAPVPDVGPDTPPTDQPLGAACGKRAECKSGHCFDGVCCNEACNDGCSACTTARTGQAQGACGKSADLEGKACGKGCGTVLGVPSVVEKVCVSGLCVVSLAPKQLESCRDPNPCVTAFCDNNEARCVKTTCPSAVNCCCKLPTGQRMCTRQDTCRGDRTCEP